LKYFYVYLGSHNYRIALTPLNDDDEAAISDRIARVVDDGSSNILLPRTENDIETPGQKRISEGTDAKQSIY
jgi:hypothetical protein